MKLNLQPLEKASVRMETVADSATKPKIVREKTEHTAATPSEPNVSEAKVTIGPFFDNRADTI